MILEKQPEINTERWTCTQWSPNDGYCDWESVLAPTSTEGQKEVILRISRPRMMDTAIGKAYSLPPVRKGRKKLSFASALVNPTNPIT